MKRRIITIAVSFLLCIGMIGAGFAAWIITGNTQVEESGNIQVEKVEDNRLNMTLAWKGDKNTIIYGHDGVTYSGGWLANDGAEQILEVTLVITLNNYADIKTKLDNNTLTSFSIEFGWKDTEMTKYTTARDEGLVGALPTPDAVEFTDFNAVTITEGAGEEAVEKTIYQTEVTFTFTWGSDFIPTGESEAVNPMAYYNGQEYTATLADAAKANLEKLYALNGETYKLVVTGEVA